MSTGSTGTYYRTRRWMTYCVRCKEMSKGYRWRWQSRWWVMTHDCPGAPQPERLYDGHIPPQ